MSDCQTAISFDLRHALPKSFSKTQKPSYFPSVDRGDCRRTVNGQVLNGLAVPQGDRVVLLLPDGTKATLEKGEIESQAASLVSVMPEGLLDTLTKPEVADLLRFLESGARARTEDK